MEMAEKETDVLKEIRALKEEVKRLGNSGAEIRKEYEEMLRKEEAFLGEINEQIEREITVMVLSAVKKSINRETVSLKVLRRRIRQQVRRQIMKGIAQETEKILPELRNMVKEEVKKTSLDIINQLKRQTGKQLQSEVKEQIKESTSVLREQAEESEKKAITDGLTGAFNRRFFETKLDEELSLAKRFRNKMCLIMFDIDHFKEVNDTYGHQAGDVILAEAVQVARSFVTSIDSLCRYGGEEFAVIMPETGIEKALETAEKIRAAIQDHAFYGGDRLINVTVSFGVAEYPTHSLIKQALIEKADGALYYAKQSGRNNVKAAIK